MLLTISTTHFPATDLGYLLAKHPAKVQTFNLAFGQAQVFYSEASDNRCTAALLLEINPVGLVRGHHEFALAQYVNDRPYVASSFLSVAIADVFRSALNGRCKERPELVEAVIPLEATLAVLPVRGGEDLIRQLFEPLGYTLTIERHTLDERFPAWGMSPYYTVTFAARTRLQDLLSHLYVLIPVLDNEKHYFVGEHEVEKLLRHGETWLAAHPARDLILTRYLRHLRSLKRLALERLVQDEVPQVEEKTEAENNEELSLEQKISLHDRRLDTVFEVLKQSGAKKVLDAGCGEGKLLARLLKDPQFTTILGMDVSLRTLDIAAERLHLESLSEKWKERIQLIQGSLMYRDARLANFDAAALVEVIEHLDAPRLAAFERVMFEYARPARVVITTPNAEYNVKWESLPAGKFRHRDHRFEWTRTEFEAWAREICLRFGYQVRFAPVGDEDAVVGAPSQMAIFEVKHI